MSNFQAAADGRILLIGCEPAAFSAALTLAEWGLQVLHLYPEPLGILGSARDIGLAYPELGEPWERLAHALGEELAAEFHQWPKSAVEHLQAICPDEVFRGSRLSVARTEQEGKLLSADAILRSKPPNSDEVRLMSGAAASNYAPIDGASLAAFETHALSFVPLKVCQRVQRILAGFPNYQAMTTGPENYDQIKLGFDGGLVTANTPDRHNVQADVCLLATGLETRSMLDRFHSVLLPWKGQAFRTQPLREKMRSSVVAVTAGWGSERYRFDPEYRLLGCGINPGQDITKTTAESDPQALDALLKRAAQLFTDFDGLAEQVMQWAVLFTTTCDGLPLLGPLPGEPRVQLCTGFGSSAWSRGWQAGRVMAEAMAGSPDAGKSKLIARCSARRFHPVSR